MSFNDTPRLDALIARLNAYCEGGRGRKAALIQHLDVEPPRVSEWLVGTRKPNGETTLAIQEWLDAQEEPGIPGPPGVLGPPQEPPPDEPGVPGPML